MTNNILLGTILLYYITCLSISLLYYFKQPKEPNNVYGYRTKRSKKSLRNWKYANQLASKYMIIITHVILILSLLVYFLYPKILGFEISLALVSLIIPCGLLPTIIIFVESKLKKYDK